MHGDGEVAEIDRAFIEYHFIAQFESCFCSRIKNCDEINVWVIEQYVFCCCTATVGEIDFDPPVSIGKSRIE